MEKEHREKPEERFFDCTGQTEAVSIITGEGPILPAGTTVYSMPVSDHNPAYDSIAGQTDLHFIFDDMQISCDFYSVPRFDIMAVDSKGGYIGMLGSICDLQDDRPVYYADSKRRTFKIAETGPDFVRNMDRWRERMIPTGDFCLYGSREEAGRSCRILDLRE